MTPKNDALLRSRTQAKVGMAVALGALVATGLLSGKRDRGSPTARTLHLCAGVAMVGFSLWHWSLYQEKTSRRTSR